MKKIFLIILILCCLICSSCKKEGYQNPDLTKETIDEKSLSDKEAHNIALPLINGALDVYDKIMGLNFELVDTEVIKPDWDYILLNSETYHRVTTINSKEELWSYAKTVFSEEAAKRIFELRIEGDDNIIPRFTEKNNRLYMMWNEHIISKEHFELKDVTVIDDKEKAFSVLADFYYTKAILHFVKREEWRLDNSIIEGELEYQNLTEATNSSDAITFIDNTYFTLNRSALTKSDAISEEEAIKIFTPLLKRAEYVDNTLFHSSLGQARNVVNHRGAEYTLVDFPLYKSLEDIESAVSSAFTKDSANRLFFPKLDQSIDNPRYLEKGEKLYCLLADRGNAVSFDYESSRLVEQYENALVLSVDTYVLGDFETKQYFVIIKNEQGWRMAHSPFYEYLKAPDFQYENITLVTLDEGETMSYAPLRLEKFPVTFVYNGEKVTINKPILTGIKTNIVRTYKQFFAFENGILVLTALEKKDGNTRERHLLLNKNGKITNTEYPLSTAVEDIAKISGYPEDVEVIQTGQTEAYKQQLYKGGVAVSEFFDEIGFFNNGLALARKDNKYGIISLDGDTIVEPFIEVDDLRYPPDYSGYQVKHLTDDAFILPINGELVIFTLTRGEAKEPEKIKTLKITFTDDFNEYVAPELCSVEDFDWGEYMPFVKYAEARYTNGGSLIHGYAFLTPDTRSLDEGKAIYKRVNDKYKITSEVIDGAFLNIDINTDEGKLYCEFLFESKIIRFSDSLEPLERVSYNCVEEVEGNDLLSHKWQIKHEVLKNGIPVNITKSETGLVYNIYRSNEKSYPYVIETNTKDYVKITDKVNDKILLISRSFYEKQRLYMYNLETQELTPLMDYAFDAKMSPDLKYLVYTNFNWENTLQENKDGFYIKNLENGKTIFYPCKKIANYAWDKNHTCEGFVCYDALKGYQ